MKTFLSILLTLAVVVLALPAPAQNQQQFINIDFSNLSVATNGQTITSTANTPFPIPQNRDVQFVIGQYSVNTGTSNTTYYLNFSVDNKTNWTTTSPVALTCANTGTSTNSTGIWINRTNLTGFAWGRFDKIVNAQLTNTTLLWFQAGYNTP